MAAACQPTASSSGSWASRRLSRSEASPASSRSSARVLRAAPQPGRRQWAAGGPAARPALAGERRAAAQKPLHCTTFDEGSNLGAEQLLSRADGDVLVETDPALSISVKQPHYELACVYNSHGRILQPAKRLWLHMGHSGWQDTRDIELQQAAGKPEVWVGCARLPASRLSSATHLEVQLVFKGQMEDGEERWDNNEGRNWGVAVELLPGEGLVTALPPARHLASSLLLRVETLTANDLLTRHQGEALRTLAWQGDFSILRVYEQVRWWDDVSITSVFTNRLGFLRRPGLHTVHVTSEMAPVAKVGGLADVVTSLAKAHQILGTLIEIIMPKYDCIDYKCVEELRQLCKVDVVWNGAEIATLVWSGLVDGLPVYFVEPHSSDAFFWRGYYYGQADDGARFLFFCRAALEFLLWSGKQPDVLHLHDWQTAAIAPLLKEEYRQRGLWKPRVMFTIHNIAYQGVLSADCLQTIGLDPERSPQLTQMVDYSRPGFFPGKYDINLLRGGIVFADKVTTVSPTYANEVLQPQYGLGLEGVIWEHRGKFCGILNGLDYETWNPETDDLIPARYGASWLEGKEECKRRLLQELGLPHDVDKYTRRPVLCVISRLTEQKGLPLILAAMEVAVSSKSIFVLLGSAPDPATQAEFEALATVYASGTDGRLILRYDEALAHRIYAGADIIIIPSFFEPCGLTQMISLRYGTIPIVRETGGLADTVKDVAHHKDSHPEHELNGFTFIDKDRAAIVRTLERAIQAFQDGADWWKSELVPRAMRQDWSWSKSAQAYLHLYRQLVEL
eukprot:SM000039S14507  [mRNA]  locus=s39:477496:482960:+ [translate_table: standard]